MPAAERREAILSAAAEVFAESGYRAGKVSDVAARIGVTEPVIFQNFGSKAALHAAVLDRAVVNAGSSLDDLAEEFGSASGLLAHVLAASASASGSGSGPGQPGHAMTDDEVAHLAAAFDLLFADAAALAAEPELREPANAAIQLVATHLAGLVGRGQEEGIVRADVDPVAAAWLLVSVISARRLRAAAMPGDLETAVTALALRALLTPLPDGPGRPGVRHAPGRPG
jgi:AcrR family transcriptional regulator